MMTQSSPEERLNDLIERIAEAAVNVRNYDMPDLSDLEEQAVKLCEEIRALPPTLAKTMEPDILRMISGLETLSAALETLQEELSALKRTDEE